MPCHSYSFGYANQLKKTTNNKNKFSCFYYDTHSFVGFFWRNYAQKTTAQTGVVSFSFLFSVVAVIIVMTAASDTAAAYAVAVCLLFIIIVDSNFAKKIC